MAVRYSGHWLRTRRQAMWQGVALLAVLLPLLAWRVTAQPPAAAIGLTMLTLAPFVVAYQTWRFLDAQERLHAEPTPAMLFLFRFVVTVPLALGAAVFLVLVNLR